MQEGLDIGIMVTKKIVINNPSGLHLRPTGELCGKALGFKSSVTFKCGRTTANAKSVLSVLGAGVKNGDEIILCCDGEDEKQALGELSRFLEEEMMENEHS